MSAVTELISKQRVYFQNHYHTPCDERIDQLKKLKSAILHSQNDILNALHSDLGKPKLESFVSEIASTLSEIDLAIGKLKKWMQPRPQQKPWLHLLSKAYEISYPRGICLIISPWNYPFYLSLTPLVNALAAGNCVIIKPSEHAQQCANCLEKIISTTFLPDQVSVIQGNQDIAQELCSQPLDFIFFTGSTNVGKKVMNQASQHLTPLVLELGGNNLSIIDETCHLETAVSQLLWSKFFNCGQTCMAPNVAYVHISRKQSFIELCKQTLLKFYGQHPQQSLDYGRIINSHHFNRLLHLIKDRPVIVGAEHSLNDLYFSPTILEMKSALDSIGQEEIFGCILPVFFYHNLSEINLTIHQGSLVSYVYSNNTKVINQFKHFATGQTIINGSMDQLASCYSSFGGTGSSGFGRYHGKDGFLTFSNTKTVVEGSKFQWIPKTPPYQTSELLFKFIRYLFK